MRKLAVSGVSRLASAKIQLPSPDFAERGNGGYDARTNARLRSKPVQGTPAMNPQDKPRNARFRHLGEALEGMAPEQTEQEAWRGGQGVAGTALLPQSCS